MHFQNNHSEASSCAWASSNVVPVDWLSRRPNRSQQGSEFACLAYFSPLFCCCHAQKSLSPFWKILSLEMSNRGQNQLAPRCRMPGSFVVQSWQHRVARQRSIVIPALLIVRIPVPSGGFESPRKGKASRPQASGCPLLKVCVLSVLLLVAMPLFPCFETDLLPDWQVQDGESVRKKNSRKMKLGQAGRDSGPSAITTALNLVSVWLYSVETSIWFSHFPNSACHVLAVHVFLCMCYCNLACRCSAESAFSFREERSTRHVAFLHRLYRPERQPFLWRMTVTAWIPSSMHRLHHMSKDIAESGWDSQSFHEYWAVLWLSTFVQHGLPGRQESIGEAD